MKKKLKAAAMVIFILFSVGMLTGCLTAFLLSGGEVNPVGETIKIISEIEITEADNSYTERATHEPLPEGGKRAINQYYSYGSLQNPPFDIRPEERLMRRTSTLIGGTPVDVSQYIVHSDSFALIGNEIAYNRLIIDFFGEKNKMFNTLSEHDITITYEINSQNYKEERTVVTFGEPNMNNALKNYIARKYNVKPNDVRKFNVKTHSTRSKSKNEYFFHNVIVSKTEKCYYQFDVEVEYSEKAASSKEPAVYKTFNKIYRSDFSTLAAATLDVQMIIWLEARKGARGGNTPLPIINFVRVEKYPL